MENKEKPSAEEYNELVASLYREHFTYLVESARRLGCSRDYAEDNVQEVFQVAMEKKEELYACENRIGWLVQTLRNRIGTNYRAMLYAQRYIEHLKIMYNRNNETQLKPEELYAGLISEEDLSLLVQFCCEGVPAKDLADSLHISLETCKKRIQRAKARFIKAYREQIDNI